MISRNGITGIFTVRTWNPEDVIQLEKKGLQITANNLLTNGFKPKNEFEQKNIITDNGLKWISGQIMKDPAYSTVLGYVGLGTNKTSLPTPSDTDLASELIITSPDYKYTRKKMIFTKGSEPGEVISDVFFDADEINTISINEIGVWTYVDTTTDPSASPIFYARVVLASEIYKTKSNPESITITRRDIIRRS